MSPRRIVVIHTAFLGDTILALPMVQALKRHIVDSFISFVAIPASCSLLVNHSSMNQVIEFDKRGRSRGLSGLLRCVKQLKEGRFDTAIVPHRSLRSALLPFLARIPARIGFSTSAGSFLYTATIRYESKKHEIDRNLQLLAPLGIDAPFELPLLYPSDDDRKVVDRLIASQFGPTVQPDYLVAIAPGSIWKTKRWPGESFRRLTELLTDAGEKVVLVGSRDDTALCASVARGGKEANVLNSAGQLSILQSAELIRRSAVLVSNDSAPMHAGVAMRTPVVAIFGATIPEFGFAPAGENDRIHQTMGLTCRPCSIHGGNECPIRTFDCMHRIAPEDVFRSVLDILEGKRIRAGHREKGSTP